MNTQPERHRWGESREAPAWHPAPDAGRPSPAVDRSMRWLVGLLLALGLLGCTVRLGAGTYWHDEALTVFLARTVARFGLPMAWDGVNFVQTEYEHQFNPGLVWTGHTWLPFYLLAPIIRLCGVDPWFTRLPFALGGWCMLALVYPAGRLLLRSKRAALWSLVAGTASVPMYLYARQCQYYPLLMLGGLIVWWALRAVPQRPRAWWGLAGGLLLLAYCQPVAVFAVVPACLIAAGLQVRRPSTFARYALAGACAAAVFLLFVLYARSWEMYGAYSAKGIPWRLAAALKIWRYLTEANLWMFPIFAVPLLAVACRPPRPGRSPETVADHRAVIRIAVETVLGLILLGCVAPDPFFRYLLPLMPAAFFLLGATVARVWAWRPVAGVLVAALLFGSQIPHSLGHRLASAALDRAAPDGLLRAGLRRLEPYAFRWTTHHAEFLYELTHPYRGSVDVILDFLRTHATPGQTIGITYPLETVALFTELRGVASLPPASPVAPHLPAYVSQFGVPDWVIVRAQFPNRLFDADAFFAAHAHQYVRHELPFPDTTWNNRPYPLVHQFRSPGPEAGPPIVIWERR